MKGQSVVHGAVSIVNAISTGKGAALGIMLKTSSEVILEPRDGKNIYNFSSNITQDRTLAEATVNEVLYRYGREKFEVTVSTESEIPEGKGLKSSSAASNSITLAALSALRVITEDIDIVKLAVIASLKSGVTLTGAFDDACASFFGGFVVTDNLSRKIVKQELAPENLSVLIYIPEEQIYTKDFDKKTIMFQKDKVSEAYNLARQGEYWKAMILNGNIHSTALGLTLLPAEQALKSGAIAAGLSGTGPAVAAVCHSDAINEIKGSWQQLPGDIKITAINNSKAEWVCLDEN
jgi:shikimate kinase